MSRILKVAAAQLGPITLKEPRSSAVKRMIVLMQNAKAQGAELVIFPELALTTFFPRWYTEDQSEIDKYFEFELKLMRMDQKIETTPTRINVALLFRVNFEIQFVLESDVKVSRI